MRPYKIVAIIQYWILPQQPTAMCGTYVQYLKSPAIVHECVEFQMTCPFDPSMDVLTFTEEPRGCFGLCLIINRQVIALEKTLLGCFAIKQNLREKNVCCLTKDKLKIQFTTYEYFL